MVYVDFLIEGRPVDVKPFITSNPFSPDYEVILGVDSMRCHGLIFNAAEGRISFLAREAAVSAGEDKPVSPSRAPQRESSPESRMRLIRLVRKERISPQTEQFVEEAVSEEKLGKASVLFFEPCDRRRKNILLISRSVNNIGPMEGCMCVWQIMGRSPFFLINHRRWET